MARRVAVLAAGMLAMLTSGLPASELLMNLTGVPDHGLVLAHVDFTAALRECQIDELAAVGLRAVDVQSGSQVPVQLVPDPDFDPASRCAGLLIARLPHGGDWQLAVRPGKDDMRPPGPWNGIVTTPYVRVVHAASKMGGMPHRFEFRKTGKIFTDFRWNDRCYDPATGGWYPRQDDHAQLQLVSAGPLCTAVRTRTRFLNHTRQQPAAKPTAVYTWIYFHDLPLAYVSETVRQERVKTWKELHFLELNFSDKSFATWMGAAPARHAPFANSAKSHRFSKWGAVSDGANTIAMLQAGQVLVYDGDGYGRYLHARGTQAWQPWDSRVRQNSAWLWINSVEQPNTAVEQFIPRLPSTAAVVVTTDQVEQALADAGEYGANGARWWRIAAAEQLRSTGRYATAMAAAHGHLPDEMVSLTAGALGMLVSRANHRVELLALFDTRTNQRMSAAAALPLFELVLHDTVSDEQVTLRANTEWQNATLDVSAGTLTATWETPDDRRLTGLRVVVRATARAAEDAFAWDIKVQQVPSAWTLWEVVFPQLAAAELGSHTQLFLPMGCGTVKRLADNRGFRSKTRYPSGWTSMQFMGLYDLPSATGLYVANHDPWGSTKTIVAQIHDPRQGTTLGFAYPVPNMGKPANEFESSGQVVWRLLRGDWFDAALFYRDWVRGNAKWYPKLTRDGRADTPQWMRELCCWSQGGDTPEKFAAINKQLQTRLKVPIAVHWYRWHQIPFDNDYPHYFPAVPGFRAAVADLQQHQVAVMPYINGRLWDTHDRGNDDFEFSRVARPAATKDVNGKVYLETYSSKEADGTPVKLAVMCPATDTWQQRVGQIVERLMKEYGVRGVYLDQIAAAQPRLCFDATHGHPLGGGHWWTEAYWQLVQRIRRQMPADRILTTECNAEPYIHCFDGYLTWHWQYDGQVPAFPAVYGGAIQMFGRAYRGGPTKNQAFRMKAGQQLVFGEQIGWMNPAVVKEPENLEFLKRVVGVRHQYRRFFYAGEMARPPKLVGTVPTVTADWQWHGEWPVTTPAVLTGAWRIPHERRAVLLFVNVSKQPVQTTVRVDPTDYLPRAKRVRLTASGAEGGEVIDANDSIDRALRIVGESVIAWRLESE